MKTLILVVTFCCSSLFAASLTDFPSSDELLPKVKKQLAGKGDMAIREIERLGNKTIQMEAFVSTDGNYDMAKKIFPNFAAYPDWTIKDINKNSSGKTYVIQIQGMKWDPKDAMMEILYDLALPVYRYKGGARKYKVTEVKDEKTLCIEVNAGSMKDAFIETSKGRFYVWPAPGERDRLWFYFRGYVTIGPWLIYEALPEQVVKKESGERVQTLLQNYQKEESRLYGLQAGGKGGSNRQPAAETTEEK